MMTGQLPIGFVGFVVMLLNRPTHGVRKRVTFCPPVSEITFFIKNAKKYLVTWYTRKNFHLLIFLNCKNYSKILVVAMTTLSNASLLLDVYFRCAILLCFYILISM
jgi:hypothetical protein